MVAEEEEEVEEEEDMLIQGVTEMHFPIMNLV